MHAQDDSDTTPDAFARALDAVLSAWADDHELGRDDLQAQYPTLGAAVDEVLDLAREIAIVRHTPLPRVPGYDVFDEVGRGGMGIVYRARQHGVDRIVALKLLPEFFGEDPRGRARLLAEARGIGRVRHPHVVTIHGLVETGEVVGYAMEWVEGRSLASLLEEVGDWRRTTKPPEIRFGSAGGDRLPDPSVPWFCRLGIAIGRALAEVHRHGLVHRDVKPGNVLLRADGTPLLSDFGLVRAEELGLTRSGQVLGTPAFAAPEQLRSQHDAVGPWSDVFALGATLHCALTGRVPFAGRTPAELLANIDARRRTPLSVHGLPRDLDTIVARCLEPEPRDRYPTADAVADDLENLLALRPIAARPLGPLARGWRLLRRNRRLVVASCLSAAIVAVLAVAAGVWIWRAVTLRDRFDAALRAARTRLLEPTHEERIELVFSDRAVERETSFERAGAAVLGDYERALSIDDPLAAVVERDTVAVALEVQRGVAPVPTAALRAHAPAVVAAASAWGANRSFVMPSFVSDTDRRAFGLLAFLTNRVKECHDAWAPLELRGDAFLDAAAGQLHLEQGDVGRAYARFARATKEWAEVGFLAVAMADCAVRLGDLEVAEWELARAGGTKQQIPFGSDRRVLADLRAAQGRVEEARSEYEAVVAKHFADTARVHYIVLLERIGDRGRALELRLDRVARRTDKHLGGLFVSAWRWWCGLSLVERRSEFVALWTAGRDSCLLTRLAGIELRRPRSIEETRTIAGSDSSDEESRAIAGLAFLKELTNVFPSHSVFCRSPEVVRSAAAGLLAVAASVSTVPSFLAARLARRLVNPIGSIGWIAVAFCAISVDAPGQTADWSNVTPSTNGPLGRRDHATAIDPATGDLLVYGGYSDASLNNFGDFWRWDGVAWALISAAAPPSNLAGAQMVSVPALNQILLFGGFDDLAAQYSDKTWLWNGTTWRLLVGLSPPARQAHSLVYDEIRNVVVMHGGVNSGGPLNDTWEWDPTTQTWIDVSPTGPRPTCYLHGMAFDRQTGKTILHGGVPVANLTSTWEWHNSTWTLINTGPARWTHAMGWDEERDAVIMFGGADASTAVGDAWILAGSTWLPLTTTSVSAPNARSQVSMVFDRVRNGLILFGGYAGPGGNPQDLWLLRSDHQPRVGETGVGCNPGAPTPSGLRRVLGTGPWVGDTLSLEATSLPGAASILILGFSSSVLPLGVLGAPSCTLYSTPDIGLPISGPTSTWTLSPVSGAFGMRFWAQTASFDLSPSAPSIVMAVSNGLELTLGSR